MGHYRRVTKEEARNNESHAWAMRQRGWSMGRIGDALGLDRSSVWRILRRVMARILLKLNDEVRDHMVEQIGMLNHVVDEAMQGWERSKGLTTKVTRRTKTGGVEETTEAASGCGDIRYLQVARGAMADLRCLLGLTVPVRGKRTG